MNGFPNDQSDPLAEFFRLIDLSHFRQCLSDCQGLTIHESFQQLHELIKQGLPLSVSATMAPQIPEKRIPAEHAEIAAKAALQHQSLHAPGTSITVRRYDGSPWDEAFCTLRIDREDAFRFFAKLGFNPPYPWPYPPQPFVCPRKTNPTQATVLPSAAEQRLPVLLAALQELGVDPLAIPRGMKSRLRDKLIEKYPGRFTQDKFEETWKYGKRNNRLKMEWFQNL